MPEVNPDYVRWARKSHYADTKPEPKRADQAANDDNQPSQAQSELESTRRESSDNTGAAADEEESNASRIEDNTGSESEVEELSSRMSRLLAPDDDPIEPTDAAILNEFRSIILGYRVEPPMSLDRILQQPSNGNQPLRSADTFLRDIIDAIIIGVDALIDIDPYRVTEDTARSFINSAEIGKKLGEQFTLDAVEKREKVRDLAEEASRKMMISLCDSMGKYQARWMMRDLSVGRISQRETREV